MKNISQKSRIATTLSILPILFFFISCDRDNIKKVEATSYNNSNEELYHSVTKDEYDNSDEFTKRLIDQIDASVNSINILGKQGNIENYEAIIQISKDPADKLSNFSIIGLADGSGSISQNNNSNARIINVGGQCTVCGVGQAYQCVKQAMAYMDKNNKDELEVHVKRVGDCFKITYE